MNEPTPHYLVSKLLPPLLVIIPVVVTWVVIHILGFAEVIDGLLGISVALILFVSIMLMVVLSEGWDSRTIGLYLILWGVVFLMAALGVSVWYEERPRDWAINAARAFLLWGVPIFTIGLVVLSYHRFPRFHQTCDRCRQFVNRHFHNGGESIQ